MPVSFHSRCQSALTIPSRLRIAEFDFLDMTTDELDTRFDALLSCLKANTNLDILIDAIEKSGWYFNVS